MRQWIRIGFAGVGIVLAAQGAWSADVYTIDATHSSIGFSVKHLMVSTVTGTFDDFKGDVTYDANFLFTNWDDFNIALRKPTCENFHNAHRFNGAERGVYILPSKYILPGFRKNPFANPAPYCPVLATCLTPAELQKAGC